MAEPTAPFDRTGIEQRQQARRAAIKTRWQDRQHVLLFWDWQGAEADLSAALQEINRLTHDLTEVRGTPASRFLILVRELEKRLPDPNPLAIEAYESRALRLIDALQAEVATLRLGSSHARHAS